MSPPPELLLELLELLDSPPLEELELLELASPVLELVPSVPLELPPVVPSLGSRQKPDGMHVASASQQLLSSTQMNAAVSLGTHSSRHT